jgi:hypothetical protein
MPSRSNSGATRRVRLRVERLEERELLSAAPAWPWVPSFEGLRFHDHRLLVRFSAEAAANLLPGAQLAPGLRIESRLAGAPGLFQIHLSGIGVAEALGWFRQAAGVVFAQPDFQISVSALPNDPGFGNQWGLNNTGQNLGTPGADIRAVQAWNQFTGSGATLVAVIDSGIDYRHPDLAANIWRNPGEIPGNGIDDDGNGYIDDVHGYDFVNNDADPLDDNRHGTHVAGIIGAAGDNGLGIAGVAWQSRLMALKVLSAIGSGYTSNAIKAINYAVANGAKIINASWGGAPYDAALDAAIQYARSQGVILPGELPGGQRRSGRGER